MKDYSSVLFGFPLEKLTYECIETFFGGNHSETTYSEYKSYHKNDEKNVMIGVKKAICGFLNSEGGILVLGAPKEVSEKGNKNKKYERFLCPFYEKPNKDSLSRSVNDSISPSPSGINIKVLQKEDEENYIIVFEVQKSVFPPHQFSSTYWMRYEGETKAAPHFLIEALFKRISFPNIEGCVKIIEFKYRESYVPFLSPHYLLTVDVYIDNWSIYEHEEDLTYRLLITPGKLINQNNEIGLANVPTKIPLLHFGMPHKSTFSFILDAKELYDEHAYKGTLVLILTGKKSPAKSCIYDLNLDTTNNNSLDEILVIKHLNKFLYEQQDELGTDRESILEKRNIKL